MHRSEFAQTNYNCPAEADLQVQMLLVSQFGLFKIQVSAFAGLMFCNIFTFQREDPPPALLHKTKSHTSHTHDTCYHVITLKCFRLGNNSGTCGKNCFRLKCAEVEHKCRLLNAFQIEPPLKYVLCNSLTVIAFQICLLEVTTFPILE